jgi:lipid-A-disaccharide synthase-like uncharacterized protein
LSNDQVFWLCVGFAGQLLFTSRFLVQWLMSELKGESVFPVAFWYLSLVGGVLLLAYAVSRVDPVIIFGQALGVVVYARNLVLVHRKGKKPAESVSDNEPAVIAVSRPVDGPLRKAG